MNQIEDLFLLDPGVVFLNHGSFGATPRPVFEAYQEWQRRLERQPVQFLDRDLPEYLAGARRVLGDYVNAPAGDLVCVPNATFGVNVVAHSLALGPGEEVLATDHEYGSCDNVWEYWRRRRGFSYKRRPMPLPALPREEMADHFWAGVSGRTRLIYISHISSSTALRFPVEEICARARQAGILTLVDGAHTLGQIPLDMQAIGADFYVSNGHKWLCSPKGSAFLYARPEVQHLVEPLVVGWGWGEARTFSYGSQFLDYLQWLGTDDLAAYLSFPTAIKFQADHDWPSVRRGCHALLAETIGRINRLTGLAPVYPAGDDAYCQMAIASLPVLDDHKTFQRRLYKEWRVEVPITQWHDRYFIRVSIQGYNTPADVDVLLEALALCLPPG